MALSGPTKNARFQVKSVKKNYIKVLVSLTHDHNSQDFFRLVTI